ncbi:Tn3 family transposase [Pantoea sp. GM01]|uniref:Tn3 family transposase n=1 Tax=Pantoea sp. GM01 TaxID=1144320 RepID=UPI00210083D8|nr:Tn3 family transposase [Pantoea sp. GM01]
MTKSGVTKRLCSWNQRSGVHDCKRRAECRVRTIGLNLLTAAISLWKTVDIERAIDYLKRKVIPINGQFVSHLSPLGWEHPYLSVDFVWQTNLNLRHGKYRSSRSVDSGLGKIQASGRIFPFSRWDPC